MSTVLIAGGSGLLGLNWAFTIKDRYSVVLGLHQKNIHLPGTESVFVDVQSEETFAETVKRFHPQLIVNTVGLTSVEECEKNPELARQINVTTAVNMAKVSKDFDIPYVHISTDHLFAGSQALAEEDWPIAPMNVYAKTKAAAEEEVLNANSKALVVRTNFYGWGPSYRRSFSDTILANLREGKKSFLFEDVFYTPILAETLVTTIHQLVENKASGIFHVAGNERLSKYTFGLKLAERFNLDADLIVPSFLADNRQLVKRPFDMSLSNKKAGAFLKTDIGSVDAHINRLYEQGTYSNILHEIQSL